MIHEVILTVSFVPHHPTPTFTLTHMLMSKIPPLSFYISLSNSTVHSKFVVIEIGINWGQRYSTTTKDTMEFYKKAAVKQNLTPGSKFSVHDLHACSAFLSCGNVYASCTTSDERLCF